MRGCSVMSLRSCSTCVPSEETVVKASLALGARGEERRWPCGARRATRAVNADGGPAVAPVLLVLALLGVPDDPHRAVTRQETRLVATEDEVTHELLESLAALTADARIPVAQLRICQVDAPGK